MRLLSRLQATSPGVRVEAFLVANFGFLAVDIGLAHAQNAFARREEWVPIGFSVLATALLLPGLVSERLRARGRALSLAVGGLAVLVGVAGMILHLESTFFERQTLRALVYTAPFVAPLSYVGLGLLLLLNRLEPWGSPEWRRWVVFLALGGFVGNLGLTLLDHAQNGFFHGAEWLAVGAAAFGTSFLFTCVLRPDDRVLARACLIVLAVAAAVGVLGAVLHVAANVEAPGSWTDRFLYGAPPFAPLLLADLAVLGALGLASGGPAVSSGA